MLFRALAVALSILAMIELRRSGLAPALLLFLLIDTFVDVAEDDDDEEDEEDLFRLELEEIFVRLSVVKTATGFTNEELFADVDDAGAGGAGGSGGSGGGGGGGGVNGANVGGNGGIGGDAFGGGGRGGNGG